MVQVHVGMGVVVTLAPSLVAVEPTEAARPMPVGTGTKPSIEVVGTRANCCESVELGFLSFTHALLLCSASYASRY